MKQSNVEFEYSARYFQDGDINESTKNLIFVLHGYGQQAKYFIRKFNVLHHSANCIIAPEGLSKFYLEGHSGRVGATWMTKEDRLTDIYNYLNYLNAIYVKLTKDWPDMKITILGFSQGAATASRWAAHKNMHFDQLILWAGIFPPDMNYEKAGKKFSGKIINYVYGTEDPFLTPERLKEMKDLSSQLNIIPSVTKFSGGHDIERQALKKIFGNSL